MKQGKTEDKFKTTWLLLWTVVAQFHWGLSKKPRIMVLGICHRSRVYLSIDLPPPWLRVSSFFLVYLTLEWQVVPLRVPMAPSRSTENSQSKK